MRRLLVPVLFTVVLAVAQITGLALGPARADEASERSWFVGFVEKTISTPDRQIRLGRIDGALSSDVRLDAITIADRRGVWLTIRDVHLVWTRTDLLKGRLSVASLDAGAIEVDRKPDPATETAAGGDQGPADFSLPDLPVAVSIDRIAVPTVRLPAEIAGRPTVLSLAGHGRLADGDLDLALEATRTVPQGGAFSLTTTYRGKTRRLALDLGLAEPKGGFLSTLLALPGEPPLDFAIRGDAPVDDFGADISLATDGRRLLAGRAETRLDGADRIFAVGVAGSLEDLVGKGGSLTGGGTELRLAARRTADGAVRLDRAFFRTGAAAFDAVGAYRPEGDGAVVALDRLLVSWKTAKVELVHPSTVTVAGSRVDIAPTSIRLTGGDASGTLDVSGSVGTDLALDVAGRRLPLSLAAIVAPDLGATGAVSFEATVRGPRKSPAVTWHAVADGLAIAATRTALPPASLEASGGLADRVATVDARLAIGRDASVTAAGRVPLDGDGLALDVAAKRLPLAFADGFSPGLGAQGTLTATAKVGGSLARPSIVWKLGGNGLSVAAGRAAKLPGATLEASGGLADRVATVDARLAIGRDASVTAAGRIPLDGDGLALDVAATRLPLAFADGVSPGLGAKGTLTATAEVGGSLAAPSADWKVAGDGLSVAATRDAGLAGMTLAANGRLDRGGTGLTATLSERDRLRLTAGGRVPLDGGELAVTVAGTASLGLADGTLRTRGAKASGRATLDVALSGPLDAPRARGSLHLADGSFNDPETATRLGGIAADVRLDGDRVQIERFQATTGKSGRLSVNGSVGLGSGLPGDLSIRFEKAELSYGDTLRTVVDGAMRLSGPFATEPTLAGRIDLGRTEITIPERFAGNAASLGVEHLRPPPEVARTLALAAPKARKGGGKAAVAWRIRLDVTVDAPGQLFVRGRGLDAELGGRLRVTGSSDGLVPVGAFELRRGSLDVIGRHIALDKGTATLTGDLDPTIDFQASSSSRSVAVVAKVTGRASDPALVLTSTPELPQDEVLAQFLFGRGVADLSGFQLVQLATAAAQLAGGPSAPDLLGAIRRSTGLDSLSTVSDSKGNAGVAAGRYIGERIYLGVTAGAGGTTDATVDFDVSRQLKLRGQTGTDGSKAGFVYEQEY